MKKPLVTVILPAYNAAKHLRQAIDSIVAQTYKNFELLVIDDGSTDLTARIILSFRDPRVKYVKNEENLGLIATLNKGIEIARGEYIVRMDADDISLPKRIEKQVSFMQSFPKVGASGTWYYTFGGNGSKKLKVSSDPAWLQANLLFNSCLCHPSTIIRKETLLKNNIRYNPEYKHAEDYDLWIQLSRVSALSNIREFLFKYRSHSGQVSEQHNETQKTSASVIRKNYLDNLGITYSEDEFNTHTLIATNTLIKSKEDLDKIEKWLLSLIDQNKKIESTGFNSFIGKMWLDSCGMTSLGQFAYKRFFSSSLAAYSTLSFWQKIRFRAKCFVRRS